MKKTLLPILATACLAGLFLTACGEGDTPPTNGGAPAAAIPESVFVEAAPEGALPLHDVKASAKEGDTVVFRARVGGAADPFVAGRAAMTVASLENITACTDRPGDTCATPWDFCCDTPEDIAANTATLQVVGPDGRPLPGDFQGSHGITHLTELVVKGKVGPRPDPSVLVIDAEAIFVQR